MSDPLELDLSPALPRLDVPMHRMTDAVIAAHRWLDTRPSAEARSRFAEHIEAVMPTRTGQAYCAALNGLRDRLVP